MQGLGGRQPWFIHRIDLSRCGAAGFQQQKFLAVDGNELDKFGWIAHVIQDSIAEHYVEISQNGAAVKFLYVLVQDSDFVREPFPENPYVSFSSLHAKDIASTINEESCKISSSRSQLQNVFSFEIKVAGGQVLQPSLVDGMRFKGIELKLRKNAPSQILQRFGHETISYGRMVEPVVLQPQVP